MKVIAFNGSPHPKGNTWQGLEMVAEPLRAAGIEVEILTVGNKEIRGCLGCGSCAKNQDEQCVIDDAANDFIQKAKEADGILLGSPVYFSGIAGTMKCFLDRLFYVSHANGNLLRHKAGASIVVLRRSGGVATLDSLNHYFEFAEMLMPASVYWNAAHGAVSGEVQHDDEGAQVFSLLGQNMAWLMKLRQAGQAAGIPEPPKQKKRYMNFIR